MTEQKIQVGNTSVILRGDGSFTVVPGGKQIDFRPPGPKTLVAPVAPAAVGAAEPRFIRVDAAGERMAADAAGEHVAVIDTTTGLMWSVESLGDPAYEDDGITQEHCIERCKQLRLLGFDDWRLPTRAELVALIDDSRHGPAIDTDLFPRVKPLWHWTSTPAAWSLASTWGVNFYGGDVERYRRYHDGFALAVRRAALAQQPAAPSGEAVGEWVMVPRVPTEAMVQACVDAADSLHGGGWLALYERVYRTMVDAAPQQPAAVDGAMERTKWRCAFCGGAYYLPSPSGRFCCEAQAKFRATQPGGEHG